MAQTYPIKVLKDEDGMLFVPYTTTNSIIVDKDHRLQEILDVKLDPDNVLAGGDIKVTPDTDKVTVDWVRPKNLTVQNNLTTTSAGQGVLDASQGKILNDKFNNYVLKETLGQKNGVATLDENAKVPAAQLPSYIDDVLEAYIRNGQTALSQGWLSATNGGAALTPETGKIYVIMTAGEYQNKQYRWGGSTYVLCNPSDVNSVNGMTGVITLKKITIQRNGTQIGDTYNGTTDEVINIDVPTDTNQLTNGAGFITASHSITGNAATATTASKTNGTLIIQRNGAKLDDFNGSTNKAIDIVVPTKVSDLTNDSAFITAGDSITGNAATATTASKTTGTLTIQRNNTNMGTFNGSANQTVNITVPTKVSELNNDSKFISSVPTASATTSGIIKIGTGLAINSEGVAYVTGEGVIPESIDWDKVNGKPTNVSYWTNDAKYITAADNITGNAATATTASKTTGTLTIQKNGTTVDTFNGSANKTVNVVVPTKTSDLTNDSNYITASASITGNAATATEANKTTGTLTVQKNGTNVDTFNGSANKTINITVPTNNNQLTNGAGYITASGSITGNAATATTASKLGTTTVGSTSQPIYLNNGVPTVCSNLSADNYLPLSGGTMTGSITMNGGTSAQKTEPYLQWKTVGSNTPYIGFATDQTDGTFILGSLKGTAYATGLAIGGGSTNLLWKGNRVLTVASGENLTLLGINALPSEINQVQGVTSNIQTQLDSKASTTYVNTAINTAIGGALAASY